MGQGAYADAIQISPIVLDTNCLLMCLPKQSPFRCVWDAFLDGKITLCVSNDIVEEYLEILSQKINYRIADNVVSTIVNRKNVRFITPTFKMHLIKADEDDNKFVDCAFVAGASCIVSNDSHFKILDSIGFPKILVLRLEAYSKMIKGSIVTK